MADQLMVNDPLAPEMVFSARVVESFSVADRRFLDTELSLGTKVRALDTPFLVPGTFPVKLGDDRSSTAIRSNVQTG